MKLIGLESPDRTTFVADRISETEARVIAELREFWSDAAGHIAAAGDAADHKAAGEIVSIADYRVVPPVLPEARVICIGLNYRAHHAEGSFKDQAFPEHPTLFARWTRSLSVDGAEIPVPANERGLDWEGEIVAYVGDTLADASDDEAQAAIVGYSTFNDVTSRIAQKLTSQWILGKNGDNSGPLGPLVPASEVGDLSDGLRVRTRVNGETVQDGNTADIVYSPASTLALISRTFTLLPGDLLATGTPEGVGYTRQPEWLLHPGDIVEVEVDRLGSLRNRITARAN
ncbi:fumarylacetoacetate hydrolase family protein [Brevibacterium sp. UCMA 11754]|uniref:fumarylacetoacetate hydrolase family protein n=1 Tax=Brevibacterium sp. UCMA 11754 TaxID=2749198 RepID=UPI001F45552D|nr:fumarylacetoacetate hydrolase family protein [Brevibacterium sp. UCMA 11754]MCF2570840.1 fumarylacetoacetate hydrolase family protein [Brevibacterium sp. UCMA 11754]